MNPNTPGAKERFIGAIGTLARGAPWLLEVAPDDPYDKNPTADDCGCAASRSTASMIDESGVMALLPSFAEPSDEGERADLATLTNTTGTFLRRPGEVVELGAEPARARLTTLARQTIAAPPTRCVALMGQLVEDLPPEPVPEQSVTWTTGIQGVDVIDGCSTSPGLIIRGSGFGATHSGVGVIASMWDKQTWTVVHAWPRSIRSPHPSSPRKSLTPPAGRRRRTGTSTQSPSFGPLWTASTAVWAKFHRRRAVRIRYRRHTVPSTPPPTTEATEASLRVAGSLLPIPDPEIVVLTNDPAVPSTGYIEDMMRERANTPAAQWKDEIWLVIGPVGVGGVADPNTWPWTGATEATGTVTAHEIGHMFNQAHLKLCGAAQNPDDPATFPDQGNVLVTGWDTWNNREVRNGIDLMSYCWGNAWISPERWRRIFLRVGKP